MFVRISAKMGIILKMASLRAGGAACMAGGYPPIKFCTWGSNTYHKPYVCMSVFINCWWLKINNTFGGFTSAKIYSWCPSDLTQTTRREPHAENEKALQR